MKTDKLGVDKRNVLNKELTFRSFVVGSCNQFVYSAAKAVASNLGRAYNPLFICGKTGNGKTHLLNAIGNHIKRKKPRAKVVYITAEQFEDELVSCVSLKTVDKFRKKYQSIDVLLFESLPFLKEKERVLDELFRIIKALCVKNKQIVITSDRHIMDISGIEIRTISSMMSGLIADIRPPNHATRLAIIKKKAKKLKVKLPDDATASLASHLRKSVWALEAFLITLKAVSHFEKKSITKELIRTLFKRI